MQENKPYMDKAVQIIGDKLYKGSEQVIRDQSVKTYCSNIANLCENLGDDFTFEPSDINYSSNEGLKVPFTI